MVNANDDLSKSELITELKANIDFNKEADFFFDALVIDIKQNYSKKKKKKTS